MKRMTLAVLGAAAFAVCAQADPVTITLLPASGEIVGQPGQPIGWGFTLTNPSPDDWVVLTGSEFLGSQVYGTYVDYLSLASAPLYVAGPAPESSTVTQAWDPNLLLGVGAFDVNATTPTDTDISGNIVIHYSVFSQDPNDPNFDPDTATLVPDATISTSAMITVTTPEPSLLASLIGLPLLLLGFARWRHRLAR